NCNSARLFEMSRGRFTDLPLADFLEADPWGESPIPYLQEAEWVLVRCSDCQQMFHKRILNAKWNERRFTTWMSADAIKEFEDRRGEASASKKFDRARGYVERILRIEKFTRSIRGKQPIRLLDFGCGFGDFLSTRRTRHQRPPRLAAAAFRGRRPRNDNGGDLEKQPDNSELCDQSEEQGNKIWRPQFYVDASLGQDLRDAGNGNVSLDDCVKQIKGPKDFQTEERKRGPERKKVDQGFHAKLLLSYLRLHSSRSPDQR